MNKTAAEHIEKRIEQGSLPQDREGTRAAFRRLVAQYERPDSPLTEEDRKNILSVVEKPDFDMATAGEALKTLPESLKKAEALYKQLRDFLKKEPYCSLFKNADFQNLTFQQKHALLERLQLVQTVYDKMRKWKNAGLLTEKNIRHKLAVDFVGLSVAEQKKRAEHLEGILKIEDRKILRGIFEQLPEITRHGNRTAFEQLPLSEQPEFLKMLFARAYKAKIATLQIPNKDGLTLFAAHPAPSAALYIRWFEEQPLTKMPGYLEHSDLNKKERADRVHDMTTILQRVKNPAVKTKMTREFNEAELTTRLSLVKQYNEKLPDHASDELPSEQTAEKAEQEKKKTEAATQQTTVSKKRVIFQRTLEAQAVGSGATEGQKEFQAWALQKEVAERKRRAELRYNQTTVEGLQEAAAGDTNQMRKEARMYERITAFDRDKSEQRHHGDEDTIGIDSIRLKETQLKYDSNARAALRRELREDRGNTNAILTGTRMINEADRELYTDEFMHSELPRLQHRVAEKILPIIASAAANEGLELSTDDKKQGIASLNWERAQKRLFDQAA